MTPYQSNPANLFLSYTYVSLLTYEVSISVRFLYKHKTLKNTYLAIVMVQIFSGMLYNVKESSVLYIDRGQTLVYSKPKKQIQTHIYSVLSFVKRKE